MGASIDKLTGEAIYAGILTDTGNFQYSNTRVKSHLITIALYELGIDHYYVSRMLYQNSRIEKFYISGKIMATLKMMADGRVVMAYVTQEMLREAGALMEDTEGTSEILRNISGVEVGIFAKETAGGVTKFSMRSKEWADVAEISMKYKGGGHTKAAGCTIAKPIFEAMKMIETDVEEYFARAEKNDN
jgi:phosphoesterase RecJ-like protein